MTSSAIKLCLRRYEFLTLQEHTVLALWTLQSQLIKRQDLASVFQNASTCTVGNVQSTHLTNHTTQFISKKEMKSLHKEKIHFKI